MNTVYDLLCTIIKKINPVLAGMANAERHIVSLLLLLCSIAANIQFSPVNS
jgi:hypothetical protein